MQRSVRHETLYRYSEAQVYSIGQLHLTPRAEPQQRVLSWQIRTPGHCVAYGDAYGNLSHMLTLNEAHDAVRIVVEGVVATTALQDGRLAGKNSLSPLIFTVPTRLTEPTPLLADIAGRCLPTSKAGTHELMALAAHIHGAVAFQTGATDVSSTAGEALALGAGRS